MGTTCHSFTWLNRFIVWLALNNFHLQWLTMHSRQSCNILLQGLGCLGGGGCYKFLWSSLHVHVTCHFTPTQNKVIDPGWHYPEVLVQHPISDLDHMFGHRFKICVFRCLKPTQIKCQCGRFQNQSLVGQGSFQRYWPIIQKVIQNLFGGPDKVN